ncbi:uncharacterized protein LOC143911019 [Arctopsyche grandis]|uniref:uncharacterized protein LOC143911019 n=1 Tax=Arctopsyche grandis TaxID=121162 RepID=UPI00406D9919
MEFGKKQENRQKVCLKLDPKKKFGERRLPGQYEILQDLLQQIKERADWLEEMEALGEGAKHREAIHHQIAERIRKIEFMGLPQKLTDMHIDGNESIKHSSRNDRKDKFNFEELKSDITERTCETSASNNCNYSKRSNRLKKCEENIADMLLNPIP